MQNKKPAPTLKGIHSDGVRQPIESSAYVDLKQFLEAQFSLFDLITPGALDYLHTLRQAFALQGSSL
jgi:hypothetical protein